ncbi:hypothetical protein O4G76_04970 [Limimaricola sp. G21655-S1]|nr:hypothetical protein [Limimaricola sp. G21655-S1]MCZ4260192.1 hypothetical protein [Limimaricola sp. G21655-S1]
MNTILKDDVGLGLLVELHMGRLLLPAALVLALTVAIRIAAP